MDVSKLARYPSGPVDVPRNGQVVIPKALRDAMGIREGDVIYFKLDADPPKAILILLGPDVIADDEVSG